MWLMVAAGMMVCAGCEGDLMAGGGGGGWFKPKGEPWSIRCLTVTGTDHRGSAESLAEALRGTPQIDAQKIRIEHEKGESAVYYGKYYRRIDRKTSRPEVTREMNRDMLLIKQLGVPGQGHYFADAKFVPLPTPDVGNPVWALDQARAVYSLRVAVFANQPGFYERKKAAAEYAAELRRKGYAAFYNHGPIQSEVLVGEFGEDAVLSTAGQSPATDYSGGQAVVGYTVVSRQVRDLRTKETFAFELWNLRKRGEKTRGGMVYNASQLVRISEILEDEEW